MKLNAEMKYVINVPCLENPNCLHTMVASSSDHMLSQTVPHWFLKQTSTLPSSISRVVTVVDTNLTVETVKKS